MKLVLLGAPGSGKGTQSQLLIKNQGMIQFSTGDLLRKAVSEKTELGLKAKDIMDEGHLVPDDLVIGLIREKLKGVSADQGVIFDGFPRTLPQAEALEGLLKEFHFSLNKAVYIKVPQQELIKRLAGRRSCSECGAAYHLHYNPPKKEGICDRCGSHDLIQRRDDTPEVIQERFETYERQTFPLIEFYQTRGLLAEIDGTAEPEDTYQLLLRSIGLGSEAFHSS